MKSILAYTLKRDMALAFREIHREAEDQAMEYATELQAAIASAQDSIGNLDLDPETRDIVETSITEMMGASLKFHFLRGHLDAIVKLVDLLEGGTI